MVSILHRNRLHIEIMTFGKRSYAVRIVIRHQKITLKSIRDSEERLMIKLIVSVKPFARLLARCGVRRVNNRIFVTVTKIDKPWVQYIKPQVVYRHRKGRIERTLFYIGIR